MTRYMCMMICVNPGYLWFSFSIFFHIIINHMFIFDIIFCLQKVGDFVNLKEF